MSEIERQELDDAHHVASIFSAWLEQEPSVSPVFQKVSADPKTKKAFAEAKSTTERVEVTVSAMIAEDETIRPKLEKGFQSINVAGPWGRVYEAVEAHTLAGIAKSAALQKQSASYKPYTKITF